MQITRRPKGADRRGHRRERSEASEWRAELGDLEIKHG